MCTLEMRINVETLISGFIAHAESSIQCIKFHILKLLLVGDFTIYNPPNVV